MLSLQIMLIPLGDAQLLVASGLLRDMHVNKVVERAHRM